MATVAENSKLNLPPPPRRRFYLYYLWREQIIFHGGSEYGGARYIDTPRRRHSNFPNWIYAFSERTKTEHRFVNPNTLIRQYLNGPCSRKLEIECAPWGCGVCRAPLRPHPFRVLPIYFAATKNRSSTLNIRQMYTFLFLVCLFFFATRSQGNGDDAFAVCPMRMVWEEFLTPFKNAMLCKETFETNVIRVSFFIHDLKLLLYYIKCF